MRDVPRSQVADRDIRSPAGSTQSEADRAIRTRTVVWLSHAGTACRLRGR